jgi:hypothetical protein
LWIDSLSGDCAFPVCSLFSYLLRYLAQGLLPGLTGTSTGGDQGSGPEPEIAVPSSLLSAGGTVF